MNELSHSLKRLMKKYNCTLEEYRKVRKAAKAKAKQLKREKHKLALSLRKSKTTKK